MTDRCPCGDVIYANTEDWDIPVCYECYVKMNEKLKPCEYCQSPLELEYMDYKPYAVGGRWFVNCTNEHCPTHFNGEDKDEVVRVWNDRVEPRCCEDCDYRPGCRVKYDLANISQGINSQYCSEFKKREGV